MKGVNSSALLWCFRRAHDLVADRAGNISIVVAASLPVFIVVLGLSFEVAQWYLAQRAMQNAADSASMAAAISSGGNPELEARAVAAQYGYVHGTDNVTVSGRQRSYLSVRRLQLPSGDHQQADAALSHRYDRL